MTKYEFGNEQLEQAELERSYFEPTFGEVIIRETQRLEAINIPSKSTNKIEGYYKPCHEMTNDELDELL